MSKWFTKLTVLHRNYIAFSNVNNKVKTSPSVAPCISSCTCYLIATIENMVVSQEKNHMRRLEGEFYDFLHRVTTNYWTYWWEKRTPTYFISNEEVWGRNAHVSTSVRYYLHIELIWNYPSWLLLFPDLLLSPQPAGFSWEYVICNSVLWFISILAKPTEKN